jgi:hypothetical protein
MTATASPGCSGDSLNKKLDLVKISYPLADPLTHLQQALAEAPAGALPNLIAELEKLKADAWSKLARLSANTSGQPTAVPRSSADTPVDQTSEPEYLSIRKLATRIDYREGTIRNLMSAGVFKLGEHYVKPRGHVLFEWPVIRRWIEGGGAQN